MPCMSLTFDPTVGPLLNVLIAPEGTLKATVGAGAKTKTGYCTLLVDTGASISCISPAIAAEVGLRSMGKSDVTVPTGAAEANTYLADVGVPFGEPQKGASTLVAEAILLMEFRGNHPQFQGLLGRDIINRGLVSIAGWDKRFTICI